MTMKDVQEYKCPSCGGGFEFDSESQKVVCPYCGHSEDIEVFSRMIEESESQAVQESLYENQEFQEWTKDEASGMRVYQCESCGGEILAEETTASSSCPYCGNKVFFKEHFAGGLKPDFVIPFKFDKKQAKEAYFKHLEGKPFLPSPFKSRNHIDEMVGLYVPYWLFAIKTNASGVYKGKNEKTWQSGDTEYTETSIYEAIREASMCFENIPVDGSKKMDDTLMESLEPFNPIESKTFNPAYLAGFVSDRYDVDESKSVLRAEERVKQSVCDLLAETVKEYDSVENISIACNMGQVEHKYGLCPVWILNTSWKEEKFTFAMNGQTGKIIGDLPVDKRAFRKFVGITAVIIALVLYAAEFLYLML